MPSPTAQQTDPRTYFAAERTFLAWIRTGLGLMGIGFAVSRFGLFLRELHNSPVRTQSQGTGISLHSGVALVSLGVLVLITSVVHHVRTVHALHNGTWEAGRVSASAVALALILALVGMGMGIYLVLLH
jgi:putative membrane protein